MLIQGELGRARHHAARLVAIARAYYERVLARSDEAEKWAVTEPVDLLIPSLDLQRKVEENANNWLTAIRICDEQIELKRRHHKSDLALNIHVFNRAGNLTRLGRLDEAEGDLLFCLRVDRENQDALGMSKDLSLLAYIVDERGDPGHAAQFETQSLEICYRLGTLSEAAISHCNLGTYLWKLGKRKESLIEICCDGLITVVLEEWRGMNITFTILHEKLKDMPLDERRAHWPTAAGLFAAYPRLGELLAGRGVGTAQVQAILDQLWEAVQVEETEDD